MSSTPIGMPKGGHVCADKVDLCRPTYIALQLFVVLVAICVDMCVYIHTGISPTGP